MVFYLFVVTSRRLNAVNPSVFDVLVALACAFLFHYESVVSRWNYYGLFLCIKLLIHIKV